MSAPRFHLGFPSPSIAAVEMERWPALARLAEDAGFDCLWHSNERFFREMFIRMAVSATATERITLGGAIAEPFAVHPALTAQSLATIADLAPGRTTLAFGAGGSGLPMMGIKRRHSALAIREAYTVVARLLAGETVDFEGEIVTAVGARLHFTPPGPIPLWIATRGDRTLEVAGEVAEGLMLASYAEPATIAAALELVEHGARAAGRELAQMRVMSRVDTCIHADPASAYEGSRLMVAKLLWASYPDRRFVERAGLAVPPELEELVARRDYDALHGREELVPDELIDAFCWSGTTEAVAHRVAEIVARTGVTDVGFWLLAAPGESLEDAVRLLAGEVVPRTRAELAAGARA
jgi:5,10-methylenetetrahydromethanopterin reductase